MEQDTGFNEFMDAFGGDTGNQTDDAQETTVETDTAGDGGVENIATEETDGAESAGGTEQEQTGEDGSQTEPNTEDKSDGDTFTLKVNKEEKTYSREEVISLAQKGADYDRVKEQLTQSRENAAALQQQLDGQKDVMDTLTEVAKEAQMEIPQLLADLRRSVWRNQGLSEDAVSERELRLKAEKENAQLKVQPSEKEEPAQDSKQRARRDLEEFRKEYPDVKLTDELLKALSGDIQGGGSLTSAYRKYEAAKKDAKIAELEKALAAEKKNKENRVSSPGSQRDSGGRREKSEFDDFMEAFR